MRPEAMGEYGITGVAEGSVLKDVIAFVEVHSTNANRSKAICRELELLGAKVEAKFTNEVTHVIYKEGTKRTRDKAQKKGVHLISVLWVDSCKRSQQHVSEKLFPANLPDPKTPPLYMAKKKRAKCMQPKAYEDELANMSQRCNKRRIRNLMVEKWKSAHGTPNSTPNSPVILVEDTQPRTPGYSSSAASTPISLTIPNTPPSMQARLDSLKKAKALQAELSAKEGTDEGSSPLRGAVDPLQRRLFQSLLGSSGTADKSSETTVRTEPVTVARTDKIAVPPENAQSDTNNPSKVLVKKNSLKRLLSLKENSPQSFLIGPEQSSEKEPRCSALFANGNKNAKSGKTSKRCSVENKGKKRKASASYDETNCEKEVTESPAKVRKTGTPVPPKPLPKYLIDGLFESGPCFRRRPRRNSIASPSADILNKETGISKGSASGQTKGRRRTIQQLQEDTSGISDEKVEKHSGCDGNEKESAKPVTMAKPQTKQQDKHPRIQSSKNNSVLASQSASVLSQSSLHGLSMSVAYGNATLSSSQNCSTLAPPRPSIDDFRLHKRRHKNKTSIPQLKETSSISSKDITTSAGSDTRQVEEESGISSGTPSRLSPLKNTSKFRRPKAMRKLPAKKANKQVSSSGTSSDGERSQTTTRNPSKFARSLVMTSLHTPEQEVVISVVKQLGQFYMTECVKDDTTHVICGEGRRTLNVLHAITHGCWLVSNAWVLRSLEAGKWLDEETYEMEEQFPAAKLARMERQSTAGLYRKTFFSPVGLVYICKKTKPPREHLVSLVQQCGGQVTTCQRKAQVIVGSEFHPDVVSVSPQWILDTISQFKLQAFDSYVTSHPKKQSSPEF